MFIRDETWFEDYMKTKSKPFMKSFYEKIRTETGVLMDKNNRPEGGKYSYDAENRKKLPKTIEVPPVSEVRLSDTDKSVSKIVSKLFPDHPEIFLTYGLLLRGKKLKEGGITLKNIN